MNKAMIREAKAFLAFDVAPTLMPNIRGRFQVRLLGLYRNHAEISISLINANREVLKTFGKQVAPLGGAVIVDQHESLISLVPSAAPVSAFLQVWLIGMDKENTEAELSLRLVDESRKELINFGSMRRRPGQVVIVDGLDVTVNIHKQR